METVSIECYGSVDEGVWDKLVASLGGGLFHCYSPVIYSARLTNAQPLFIKALDAQQQCIGVAAGTVCISRFWPFSRYCRRADFWSLPASREGDMEMAILAAIECELRRRGVFALSVSSYDSRRSATVLLQLGFATEVHHEFYVDLSKSMDEIWRNFVGARRTDVRKAEKLGVETRCVNSRLGLELVYDFHVQSMRRRESDVSLVDRKIELSFEHFLRRGLAMVLVSYRNAMPINAAMFGMFAGKSYYLVSGSSEEGNKSAGPAHAIWTAIRTLKEQGYAILNLGGAGPHEQSLFRFKKAFGAEVVLQPVGRKKIDKLGSFVNSLGALVRR